MLDRDGCIRDLSGVVADITPDVLAEASFARLRWGWAMQPRRMRQPGDRVRLAIGGLGEQEQRAVAGASH